MQLETELGMIAEVGYEEYFLTVWDLLQHCRRAGIEWITRGSAADSLVCFCLGISDVCPVRFELYFQRFLNRDRMALKKLPDIDLDFPHDRKDEVVEMVFRLHKPGHVAMVGGFNTFHARSAVAEIGKVLGMSDRVVRRLTEHFPWLAKAADADAAAATAKAQGLCDEEPALTAIKLAARLEGLPRHAKMHPCGVVLSRRAIQDFTPVFESNKGWPTTHFDMDAVEDVGLVKLDILAQGGLAVLRDTRQALASRSIQVPVGFAGPWDDAAVWEMIATGNARGVHHIESPAMTSLAKMCGCRDIDSLVAIVSVIRPGAANTFRKSTFARRALGLERPEYPHPSLEPVLRSTHGVIAYEEHILQVAETFAAMPPGRADILRRALVKMRDADIEKMRLEFEECARGHGRSEAEIAGVWGLVHMFRGYAFCRAHSTAYALEAWQAACLKKYHPAEFLAAVLTHGKGFYSRLLYSLECRRLGIGFLPPDVNASRGRFFAESENFIRVPLEMIAHLPQALLESISSQLKSDPFQSLEDFFERTGASEESLHLLLRAGALDSLVASRTQAVWDIKCLVQHGSSMFSEKNYSNHAPAAPLLERLRDEFDLLGFTVSAHPLDLWPDIAWDTYCPVSSLGEHIGHRITLCGLVVADRTHHQSNGAS
jgi:DNA-directed DNA polymerase III PolC